MPRRINKEAIANFKLPESGILTRVTAGAMFGVDKRTIDAWRKKHAFPMSPLPSGEHVTSIALVNEWLAQRGDTPMQRARKALARLTPEERLALLKEATAESVPEPAAESGDAWADLYAQRSDPR